MMLTVQPWASVGVTRMYLDLLAQENPDPKNTDPLIEIGIMRKSRRCLAICIGPLSGWKLCSFRSV